MDSKWLTYSGRAVALLWALWWTVVGVVSGVNGENGLMSVVIHTILPGLIFLTAAMLAWRWEPWGTIPLIVMGVWMVLVYEFARTGEGLLTVSLPPVAGGGLLLAGWWAGARGRKPWSM